MTIADPDVQNAIAYWNSVGRSDMANYVQAANTPGATVPPPPDIAYAQIHQGDNAGMADYASRVTPNQPGFQGFPGQNGVPAAPPAGTTGSGDLTDAQKSAQAQINSTLAQYGLSALGSNLWKQFLAGVPLDQIYLDMRNTPEYKARFPGMDALSKQGRSISEGDYVSLEKQYKSILSQGGISPDVMPDTPDTYAKWIAGDVSPAEVKSRVDLATQAAMSAPQETRSELARLYGIGPGEITSYWLAPDRALPALQQRFAAAQLAGTADQTGYAPLAQGQAEQLAQLGVTQSQAQSGFSALAKGQELFNPLDTGEDTIGQDAQINAQFGNNAQAQTAIQNRIARRKAQFAGGGSAADGGRGIAGLGTSTTTTS